VIGIVSIATVTAHKLNLGFAVVGVSVTALGALLTGIRGGDFENNFTCLVSFVLSVCLDDVPTHV